jgi:hypothetical protein
MSAPNPILVLVPAPVSNPPLILAPLPLLWFPPTTKPLPLLPSPIITLSNSLRTPILFGYLRLSHISNVEMYMVMLMDPSHVHLKLSLLNR